MNLSLGYQVGLKQTYPEETPTGLESYLKGIPRESVLLVVSFLLAKKEIYDGDISKMLGIWFRASNQAFAQDAHNRLHKAQNEAGSHVTLVANQPAALFIYAFANNHLDETKTQTDEQIEISLFKAFLFQNDVIASTEETTTRSTEKLEKDLRLYAMQFSNAAKFADVVNFDLEDLFFSEFIRAVMLFEFLERDPKAIELLKAFYQKYDVKDWKDYIKRISGISLSILRKEKDGHLELELKGDTIEADSIFLDRLASVKYDEPEDKDFITIRERPLHKVSKEKYRVISEVFAIEKIFKGLYFILKGVNESIPKEHRVKDFRGLYTYQFSEKYVLYQVIENIFPKKLIRMSGESIGIDGASDYYVRDKNKVFLFESKDSLINAGVKMTGDFAQLEADLSKKFYVDGQSRKAVKQLLNSAREIFSGEAHQYDPGIKLEFVRIFPVLVVHDRQLEVVGFNKIINKWFSNEVKALGVEIPAGRLFPITVISISALILYQELFHDNRIALDDLIDKYHEKCKVRPPN